jgi:omega-6 fatty acid desaturase (delta-12 desaturase)
LNFVIGHLTLVHLLYPFHAWRHVHNLHHAHTNSLELDTDWAPIPEAVYHRMALRDRIIYISVRTWAVWGGTIHHWMQSGLRPSYFPKREMRRDARRSLVFVAVVGGAYLATLTYFTGWQGLLLYFVAPWFATHVWFSITTLMHHSAEDIPYLTSEHWTRNASKLLVTTDFVYPRWLLFLTHNISLHTAHHVSPAVPFYHLGKAQAALLQAYPEMMRVETASARKLWNILRYCRFYDPVSGLYSTHPMRRAVPQEKGPA